MCVSLPRVQSFLHLLRLRPAAGARLQQWLVPRLGRWCRVLVAGEARAFAFSAGITMLRRRKSGSEREGKSRGTLSLSFLSLVARDLHTYTHTGTHPFQSSLAALPLSLRFPFDV